MIDKLSLLDERGWKCELCGDDKANDYQVHHCLFHRMKGHPELDEKYNLMIVCQKCHPYANAYRIRCLFWQKQVRRYGNAVVMDWYERVDLIEKPLFWKGYEGYFL